MERRKREEAAQREKKKGKKDVCLRQPSNALTGHRA